MADWFIIDGKRSDDMDVVLIDYSMPFIAARVYDVIDLPGQDGDYAHDTGVYRTMPIQLTCAVLSEDERDLQRRLDPVRTWIDQASTIEFWVRPGITYDIRINGEPKIDIVPVWGLIQVSYTAQPHGRGMEYTHPVNLPIQVGGTKWTPCVIRLTLTAAPSELVVMHPAGQMRISGPFSVGQELVIDSGTRRVTLNGIGIMPRVNMASRWPKLTPGAQKITVTGATGRVTYQERR